MPCAPVANIQKWGPRTGTRSALTHIHSILPPATCRAMAHLARTAARTAYALCRVHPDSLAFTKPHCVSAVLASYASSESIYIRSSLGAAHSSWMALALWACLPRCRLC
jgi:hypothetical protein